MEEVVARKKFLVDASLDRVWSLVGRVIVNNLRGLERMQFIDENSFRALLRVKVAFASVTMHLTGEVIGGTDEPRSLAVLLKAKGVGGIIKLNQKVTFSAVPIGESKTEVACESVVQEMGFLPKILFLPMVKSMAGSTLDRIEKRLKQIA